MFTQVFILCDKPKYLTSILISFMGTEPFDADDWITDFDFSWYEFLILGKVHMGSLEAFGLELGNREKAITFQHHLQMKDKTLQKALNHCFQYRQQKSYARNWGTSAYYAVKENLKDLLKGHKNAKFVVPGHSLGGALAILVAHKEKEIMQSFTEAHLDSPIPKYFRVVYCNDMVPRLPYDDTTFLYKHSGVCLCYYSCYIEQVYLFLEYLNAVFTMGYKYGAEYEEGWFSVLMRIMGLVFRPTDYVNSMRLGKKRVVQMSSF